MITFGRNHIKQHTKHYNSNNSANWKRRRRRKKKNDNNSNNNNEILHSASAHVIVGLILRLDECKYVYNI